MTYEAYDYYENKWNYLPDMIEEREDHALVSMGNKLFAFGGEYNRSCEVFDSFTRKFTLMKANLPKLNFSLTFIYNAVNIGSIIYVLSERQSINSQEDTALYIYDVEKNHWLEKNCSVLKYLSCVSCVKYCTD